MNQKEKVLVPIEELTDAELKQIAHELHEKARAYNAHADELDRYREWRARQQAEREEP